jgi:hypothetical protein
MDEDDIAKAFEGIKPEDFLRETSALDRLTYTQEQTHFTAGVNNFNGFVDAHVRRSRDASHKPKGFHAFSTLHNRTEQRHYHPDDDETAQQYAGRLAREATEMDASWFYTAMLAPGRAYSEGDEPPDVDPDDPEALAEALSSGILQLSICWYAQSNEQDPPLRRSGIIVLDKDGHATEMQVEGEIDADNNPFHHVMGNYA